MTANNRPSDSGPYISLDFAGSARYDRISQLIEELSNASLADMKKIHSDVISLRAPEIIDAIVKRVSKVTHPLGAWLLSSLTEWNCEVSENSVEASLYAVMRRRWCESVGERLGVSNPQVGAPGWPSPEAASRMLADSALVLLLEDRCTLIPGLEADEDLDSALS